MSTIHIPGNIKIGDGNAIDAVVYAWLDSNRPEVADYFRKHGIKASRADLFGHLSYRGIKVRID